MVLSNKKLKRKLRAAKAESLTISESAPPEPSRKQPPTKETESKESQLQELLEAAKQRPRLSKREKRRKIQSFQGLDGLKATVNGGGSKKVQKNDKNGGGEGGNGENEEGDKGRKKGKRKREEGESGGPGTGEVGGVKEVIKVKKKKKKKKMKKKGKKSGEEKISVETGGVAEAMKVTGESQVDEDIATKVYVGGIPYYSTEDDIQSFFEGCGTITDIDCMKFPDSGKFRGIAIISFKTEAAAKRALALDGADMGGFYLKIQPYKTTRANKVSNFTPEIVKGYNKIYVGNLSWDITEDDLKKFFSDCKISSIRFGMDKETEEFRGYAHVDFSDNLSLMMALKLDQQIVCGRPIKISCAVPKKGATVHVADAPTSNEASNDAVSSISGKIKRRTCYECGEKGHISTACSKKQAADPTNVDTS